MTRIHRVVAAVAHRATPEDVADGVTREAVAALGARAALIALFDGEHHRGRVLSAHGYPPDIVARWTDPTTHSEVLEALHRGEPMFTRSRVQDPRFDPSLVRIFGAGAGFAVPLQAAARPIGYFAMSFDEERDFDEHDRAFIMTLAGQCAHAIERAQLFVAERDARAAADAARRQLEAVLRQLPVGVSVHGTDGHIVINDEARRIWGTSIQTIEHSEVDRGPATMQRSDGSGYGPGELPIERALAGETVTGETVVIRRVDGQQRIVEASAAPVRDEGGAIRSAVAIFSDVTAQRLVQEELRTRERRYDTVLRATHDVIWELDIASDRLSWNGALERIFGYRPDETVDAAGSGYGWWHERVHPDDLPAVTASFTHARTGSAPDWSGEYRFRHADGHYVAVLDRCVFERDAAGVVVRIVGAISDVSEQRRLFEELRDAVRTRDDFLSIASHELRTPLAALRAQLLGLQQLPLDEAGRARKLAAADRQTRRLSTLIDELLDVSRIVHGRLRLEREPTDLVAVVADVAARLADDFERAGTRLHVDAPPRLVGRWDRLRLDLVVTNLLTNALRYGERRPVEVRLGADDGEARLVVEDHGIGVRPEDQARIFERFGRAVPSRQFPGLGVGLWLTREIVQAHGGRIGVESRPGAGARFTVSLPREHA